MACRLVVALLSTLAVSAIAAEEFKYKTCKRAQPPAELNECTRHALQIVIPQLANGLPKYGVLPLDPIRIDKLVVPRRNGAAVNVDLTFNKIDIHGFKYLKLNSVEIDVDKMTMKLTAEIPGILTILGDYEVDGKVLVLPIQGSGPCNITLVHPVFNMDDIRAQPVTTNAKRHANITTLKGQPLKVDRMHVRLENLFNGNKELGDNMNQVLNDNWKELFDGLAQPIFEAVLFAFRTSLHNALLKVPYDNIFT